MIQLQTEGGKKTVLLQQNGAGRTFLQFTSDNKYATYVNQTDVFSDKTFDAKQWQHVTITYDTDTKKVTFYVMVSLTGKKQQVMRRRMR